MKSQIIESQMLAVFDFENHARSGISPSRTDALNLTSLDRVGDLANLRGLDGQRRFCCSAVINVDPCENTRPIKAKFGSGRLWVCQSEVEGSKGPVRNIDLPGVLAPVDHA